MNLKLQFDWRRIPRYSIPIAYCFMYVIHLMLAIFSIQLIHIIRCLHSFHYKLLREWDFFKLRLHVRKTEWEILFVKMPFNKRHDKKGEFLRRPAVNLWKSSSLLVDNFHRLWIHSSSVLENLFSFSFTQRSSDTSLSVAGLIWYILVCNFMAWLLKPLWTST